MPPLFTPSSLISQVSPFPFLVPFFFSCSFAPLRIPSQWFAGKSTPPMYIKAGAYLQSAGNDKTVGGLVEFSSLYTYHSQ